MEYPPLFLYIIWPMDYADRKTLKEIRTNGISNKIFDTYLKKIDLVSLDNISIEQVLNLMKIINNEYKAGSLSLDEMSSAYNLIYARTIYDNNFHTVNDILEMGAGLSYYERVSVENEPLNTEFVSQLKDVLRFSYK